MYTFIRIQIMGFLNKVISFNSLGVFLVCFVKRFIFFTVTLNTELKKREKNFKFFAFFLCIVAILVKFFYMRPSVSVRNRIDKINRQ